MAALVHTGLARSSLVAQPDPSERIDGSPLVKRWEPMLDMSQVRGAREQEDATARHDLIHRLLKGGDAESLAERARRALSDRIVSMRRNVHSRRFGYA